MANRFINHLSHTEFGASLNLNEEQEKICKVVYKLSEKHPDRYIFHGLWNPEKDYSDEYVILPVRSTAAQKISRPEGYEFSNIVNSSSDPKISGQSWLGLLRNNGIVCDCCKTDGKFYNPTDGKPFEKKNNEKLECSAKMVGGHVYPGRKNIEFENKEHKTVELIPICTNHNTYSLGDGKGTGKGFFMKLGRI